VSHRAHLVNGVKHGARCCCPACDPKGLVAAAYREKYQAERRAAAAVEPDPTVVRPVVVARRPLPSRGADRRMKRFHELREVGWSRDAAFEQVEKEHREGLL
jgi:hypothetical protein